jgi:outer membrane receptor protein involved in Fe transport
VDSKTKGVELNVTGELTPNWNVRFNYSYTERTLQNAFPRVNAWAESTLRPFWRTWNRDNPTTPAADNILDTVTSGTNTLRTLIENFESNLATRTIARMRVTGARPHKANIFSTYSFKEGALRGSRFGGGVRYDSANYAGQTSRGEILKGRSNTAIDLMAAHTRKLFGHPVTFQLNVRNAFERDPKVGPSVINESGNWDTLILQPPREITFTLRASY